MADEIVVSDQAFPRLSAEFLDLLDAAGRRRPLEPGTALYRAGEVNTELYVILHGRVALVDALGSSAERVIGFVEVHRFTGELNLMTGQPAYLTPVVSEAGEAIVLTVDELQGVIGSNQALGDVILRAFLARRAELIGLGSGMRLVGFPARSRQPAAAGVPHPQPHPARVPRPGSRHGRGAAAARAVGHPRRDPAAPERPARHAQPHQPRGRRGAQPEDGLAGRGVRHGGRGRRPGRARRGGVRGLRGAHDRAGRLGRARRTGEHVRADRELPRLPGRDLGLRARRTGVAAGHPVRRAHRGARPCPVAEVRRRLPRHRARRRRHAARSLRRARHRRQLPPPRRSPARGVRGHGRLLRGHGGRGADVQRQPGGGRGRSELGRPGRRVPRRPRRPRGPAHPRRRPRRGDVELPRRAGAARSRDRRAPAHRGTRAARRRRAGGDHGRAHRLRRATSGSAPARCSSSSAPSRAPTGWPERSPPTRTAS